jgi:hypothetical protein
VTPHDRRDSDPGGGRQNRRRDPVTRDTTAGQHDKDLTPGDRDDRPIQQATESQYDRAAARQPDTRPLKVKVEFVVVRGPAAVELIKRQAAAVRDALQWFADHPPD